MKSLLTLIFLLTVSAAHAQTIRYVTPTGTTPAASATTSWATSTTDLQGAINASQSGDQIWVAAGTYQPASGGSFSMKNGVAIYGGFMGTETDLSQRPAVNPIGAQGRPGTPSSTTLLGNGSRVITNPSGLTTTAVLDGFVITGGGSVELGGGMYNDNSSPTLRNCLFRQNTVMSIINGGVFCEGGAIYNLNSNPVLTNCLFSQNAAMGDESNNAGAIYNEGSSLTLTNCAFSQNSVTNGFNNAGGAMFNQNSRMVLTNCLFSENTVNGEAATYAGAIYNVAGSRMVLTNCSFRGNVASSDNAITYGGAFYSVGSGTSLVMLNCSMQGNVASRGGAIFNAGSATLTNCVVFGNGGSRTFVGAIPASYSLFDRDVTGYSGANNLTTSISPFVSTTSDALAANSAAINVGSPLSQTAATGPYSETALPTTDLAGNPRQIGCRVDMGAMEYQKAIYPTRLYVKADASGSGSGLSWDDAFTDLQRALTYPCSQSLTEIWVATGTYQPASGSSFSMLPGVAIYGGFAGGEGNLSDRPAVNPLSGNPLSATLAGNGSRVINNPASLSLTTTAVLDGFVITGGGTVDKGGGMYNESGSPTLRNCLFRQNTVSSSGTSYGGAVYLMNSAPVFTNCVFSQNTSSGGNSYAGAMFNDGSSPVLTNCTFSQNGASGTAQNGGGQSTTQAAVLS